VYRPNRIHAALREKRKAHGFRLTIPSAETLEILGSLDFDFVLIDDEHGVFGNADLEHICRTADLVGITPIARVPDCSAATIGRRLDRGIRGIVAPHVSTQQQAEEVAQACYFGPLGQRSLGGGRGVDYQLGIADMPAYYRQSNDNIFVAVMIEDVEGMRNIEEICAVKGIHTVLVGNNDFAQSLGHPGDASHPAVKAAIAGIGERVRKCGLPMREDIWVLGNLVDILVAGGKKFARSTPGQ
jgi:4-hydroxy-2-oxoheptanedioate aldolase